MENETGKSRDLFIDRIKVRIFCVIMVTKGLRSQPHPTAILKGNLLFMKLNLNIGRYQSISPWSCTPVSHDISQQRNSDEDFCHSRVHSGNISDATGRYTQAASPYYIPGVINQVTMPPASMYHKHSQAASPYYMPGVINQVMMPPASMYHKHTLDMRNHSNPAILPSFKHIPQSPPRIQGMVPYPYYTLGICLQPGQMPAPAPHTWPFLKFPSVDEEKSSKVDQREAALMKFKQKRKERCFDKKIRYVNRKKLAERRPRLRGQFVRKVNGITVDLNGQPASAEEDEYDEEEDDS